jgi:Fe-S cluster assembly protein SufD
MTTTMRDPDTRYRELVSSHRREWPGQGPDWLVRLREQGATRFEESGFPTRRDEAWRYTSLEFLERHAFQPAGDIPFRALQTEDIEPWLLPQTRTARLVFVNGRYSESLSSPESAGHGVTLGSLREHLERDRDGVRKHLGTIADGAADAFASLNMALMADGAFVRVAAGATVSRPIELLHVSVGMDEPAMAHPHHLIVLEDGARASLIERYVALGDAMYFNNAMVEVSLGEGAELFHDRLQEESTNAYHLAALHVAQAAASRYRHVTAALGGAWARTGITLGLDGEGAVAELDGVYLARDRQLNDVHLDVRHNVPRCESRERFKGILDGMGRAVFDGRILVARDAQKTDAALSNDNLMLSRKAEIDTKPQLEIYADDVRCSHGTTVGQLDEAMLFYLRSRGIDADEARQMLCLGFAGEILERFSAEGVRQRARGLLARRLGGSRSGH